MNYSSQLLIGQVGIWQKSKFGSYIVTNAPNSLLINDWESQNKEGFCLFVCFKNKVNKTFFVEWFDGAPEQVHWYLWASSLAVQEPGNSLDPPRPRTSPPPASVCTLALTSGEPLRDYFEPKAPTQWIKWALASVPRPLDPCSEAGLSPYPRLPARAGVSSRAAAHQPGNADQVTRMNGVDFLQGSIVALLVSAWHRRRMEAHITEPTRQNCGHDSGSTCPFWGFRVGLAAVGGHLNEVGTSAFHTGR